MRQFLVWEFHNTFIIYGEGLCAGCCFPLCGGDSCRDVEMRIYLAGNEEADLVGSLHIVLQL